MASLPGTGSCRRLAQRSAAPAQPTGRKKKLRQTALERISDNPDYCYVEYEWEKTWNRRTTGPGGHAVAPAKVGVRCLRPRPKALAHEWKRGTETAGCATYCRRSRVPA